jgi:uncharacterized membrane protein YbhN (UPF0104 family)
MLKKRILALVKFLIFLGLGIFIVGWMARGIDEKGWEQIRLSLSKARYVLLVPVFILLLLSHYFRALRWKMLMEPLGYTPSTFNVFNSVLVGYMANLAFPRLGEVLKCTLLAKYEKTGPDKLVGTIVAERAVDLLSLFVIFFLTIIVQVDIVGEYATNLWQQLSSKQSTSSPFLLLIIFLFISGIWIFIRWVKKHPENLFLQKIGGFLNGIWMGLISIRYVRNKSLFILYSVIIWTLYYLGTRIGFYAMQEVENLGTKEALSVLSFGSIGMIVTQGGLGAYQYAVQETLFLYQIDKVIGFTYGWVLWLAQTIVILIGGLFAFIVLPFYNRNK